MKWGWNTWVSRESCFNPLPFLPAWQSSGAAAAGAFPGPAAGSDSGRRCPGPFQRLRRPGNNCARGAHSGPKFPGKSGDHCRPRVFPTIATPRGTTFFSSIEPKAGARPARRTSERPLRNPSLGDAVESFSFFQQSRPFAEHAQPEDLAFVRGQGVIGQIGGRRAAPPPPARPGPWHCVLMSRFDGGKIVTAQKIEIQGRNGTGIDVVGHGKGPEAFRPDSPALRDSKVFFQMVRAGKENQDGAGPAAASAGVAGCSGFPANGKSNALPLKVTVAEKLPSRKKSSTAARNFPSLSRSWRRNILTWKTSSLKKPNPSMKGIVPVPPARPVRFEYQKKSTLPASSAVEIGFAPNDRQRGLRAGPAIHPAAPCP